MNAWLLAAVLVVPVQGTDTPMRVGGGPGTSPATVATAVRAVASPVLDGRGSDAVWTLMQPTASFRQFDPVENGEPRFATEFRVAYDDRNLYVLVRAYDPHPDSIRHALTRRDQRGPSDQLKLVIDPFHDRRNGYEFAVNPDGVKRDFAVYDDGNEDDSWNGVWDVATRVDSLGWTAEFRIPFSQLRYSRGASHTFGFGVWRDIERYKERVAWPLFRRTKSGFMSQMGELSGIGDIEAPGTLELAPYVVAKNLSQPKAGGYGRSQQFSIGGDLKYGLSPNVTLNATVNPDFGQVEADPAVLNLTAFETFLQERRPFFVEGTGVYRLNLNCVAVHDCGNEGLFYSRRIGRRPQLSGLYGDDASPQATPIAGAAKLTGRTSRGLSFGVLEAVTERVVGSDSRTIEPLSSYAVARVKQDFRNGQSGIGLIGTAVNRSLDSWSEDELRRAAYVGGADFRHKFHSGNYQVSGSFTASQVRGSPAAIAATQTDAVHNYQRPDGGFALDSSRTTLSGNAQEVEFGKFGGGITRFELSYTRQSPGYDVNDLGFLRRGDQQTLNMWAALRFAQPHGIYKWAQWNVNQWNAWTTRGLRMENAYNTNFHMTLKNNWSLHTGGTLGQVGDVYCDRCARGGPAVRVSRVFSGWSGIQGDDRYRIVPGIWFNYGTGDEGRSSWFDFNPQVDLHLSTRFVAGLGLDYNVNHDDWQWYGNHTDAAGTHYSFAHLDQRTLSLNSRLAYTVTPDLTVQFYAQPFVSTGEYSNVRELSATPRAASYDARYRPYAAPADAEPGFQNWQLASNTVVRWEYRPGSTLFLVWSHNRNAYESTVARRGLRSEYGDLFDLHPANTLLIKVAYWINK